MKIKNLKLYALTMAGMLVPFSLCGCSNSTKVENVDFEQTIATEETTEQKVVTKKFNVGEHYMTVEIDDPTKQPKQYRYIPGYKVVGISTSAYGQNFYTIVGSEILYVNDYPVEVVAKKVNGIYKYTSFGTPLEYDKKEHNNVDGKKEFFPGEHIISVPYTKEMLMDNDFRVYDGYEPIGIAKAMAGKNLAGFAGGCILYVNTETVLCTRDKNNEYTLFGDVKIDEKTMEKIK